MKKIAVIGAGSWGTALAFVLAENGHDVYLHSHNEKVALDVNEHHRNQKYLPNHILPNNICCSTDYRMVLQGAEDVLFVVPSHAMRETAKKAAPFVHPDAVITHASKGIEIDTSRTISEILTEELPASVNERIVVLSGPSHAEEVIKRNPTTVVAASVDIRLAQHVQSLFMNPSFRVYTNTDVKGVELGGSLKNIIGLAAGVSDGLGYGDNAKAALLTRGLMEIMRFGTAMGANPQTFSGLAGIGDLIVTGTSQHSRNWRTGNLLAQGKQLDDVLASLGMVAEGVKTTKAVYHISQNQHIEMPITTELYRILFEGKDPRQAVTDLMNRYKTAEF